MFCVEQLSHFEHVQKVLGGCRITIFDEARKTLGIKEGDFVILELKDGSLTVIPAEVKPKKNSARKVEKDNLPGQRSVRNRIA